MTRFSRIVTHLSREESQRSKARNSGATLRAFPSIRRKVTNRERRLQRARNKKSKQPNQVKTRSIESHSKGAGHNKRWTHDSRREKRTRWLLWCRRRLRGPPRRLPLLASRTKSPQQVRLIFPLFRILKQDDLQRRSSLSGEPEE